MSQEKFQTEVIGNLTLTSFAWKTEQGWTSKGLATEDLGREIRESTIHPVQNFFDSKAEAGEAAMRALKDRYCSG